MKQFFLLLTIKRVAFETLNEIFFKAVSVLECCFWLHDVSEIDARKIFFQKIPKHRNTSHFLWRT